MLAAAYTIWGAFAILRRAAETNLPQLDSQEFREAVNSCEFSDGTGSKFSAARLNPLTIFRWAGFNPLPVYPELWQCICMILGVYGIGYGIAAWVRLATGASCWSVSGANLFSARLDSSARSGPVDFRSRRAGQFSAMT